MKLTNFAPAARGVSLKDGTTVWLEPGQSETFDKDKIVEPLPDLGRKQDEATDNGDDKARIAELEAEVADLKAKLAALDRDGDGKPGGSKAAEPVSLTGKNKADLLDIAKAEGVTIEDGATNDDIKSAIELAREEAAKF
ncbi:hypothetical protein [Sphingomonas montanisoli]|uniref:Uncharacterized protein n=1 Tax=Sphingomonas montanisoli TaxID=2606412 RepID=A0A5D9C1P9_9SPHN|nr:hypothetical protein [Sphingomonas montanisoli]TZG25586.1 hypothetical protein FYJ91_11200 [Sphingomonas montanisoli]